MRLQTVRNPPAMHLPKLMAEDAPLAGQFELAKYLLFELNEAHLQSPAMMQNTAGTSAQSKSEQNASSSRQRSRQRQEASSPEFSSWASGNSQHTEVEIESRTGSDQRLPNLDLPFQRTAKVHGSETVVTSGQIREEFTRGLSEAEAADADTLTMAEEEEEVGEGEDGESDVSSSGGEDEYIV